MPTPRSPGNPRFHRDLDPETYDLPQFAHTKEFHWDMRIDPRIPGKWPRHFNYYNLPVTAVKPNITRMGILFNFMDRIRFTWPIDVVHRGPRHPRDGNAVICEDVAGAIYDMLNTPCTQEDVSHPALRPYNKAAMEARLERCAMLDIPEQIEFMRRIDYVKAVMGGTYFAGLEGFERMLSTTYVRVKAFH